MAAPRKYPDELRERAVRLVLDAKAEPGSAGTDVCRRVGEQLGISSETLRGWVKQAEIDAGTRPGTSIDTAAGWRSWNGRTASCGGRTRS